MIAEIRFKNMFSYKDENIISFKLTSLKIWNLTMSWNWQKMLGF